MLQLPLDEGVGFVPCSFALATNYVRRGDENDRLGSVYARTDRIRLKNVPVLGKRKNNSEGENVSPLLADALVGCACLLLVEERLRTL